MFHELCVTDIAEQFTKNIRKISHTATNSKLVVNTKYSVNIEILVRECQG